MGINSLWENIIWRQELYKDEGVLPHHLKELKVNISARLDNLLCKVRSLQQFNIIPKVPVKAVVEGFAKDIELSTKNRITSVYMFDSNWHPMKAEEHCIHQQKHQVAK